MPSLPAFEVNRNVCHNVPIVILGAGASETGLMSGEAYDEQTEFSAPTVDDDAERGL